MQLHVYSLSLLLYVLAHTNFTEILLLDRSFGIESGTEQVLNRMSEQINNRHGFWLSCSTVP